MSDDEDSPSDDGEQGSCDHGFSFDEEAARDKPCPKGCGFEGVYYASYLHYLTGDW